MRQVGTLPNENNASRFAAYLVTQGIAAHSEQDGDEWAIWVRDEDEIDKARDSFDTFRRDPDDSRYKGVEQQAESIRMQDYRRRVEATKNVVEMRGRWKRPGAKPRGALTMTLVILSVVVGLGTSFSISDAVRRGERDSLSFRMQRQLLFWDPLLYAESGNPLCSVQRGEVWRLVTPIFLHGGILHLVFNMYWFVQFGGQIEALRGTWRFALVVLLTASISCMAQAVTPAWEGSRLVEAFAGGAPFGGMSGVVYGLFGFVWMRSQFEPGSGFILPQSTTIILVGWLFLCMTGVIGNVANVAHLVGLIVGMTMGYLPTLWKR
jgi:GlpG protein